MTEDAQNALRIRLNGTDRQDGAGATRARTASQMLENGETAVTLGAENLPFDPGAVAVRNDRGEVLGYLPKEAAAEVLPLIPEEGMPAVLVAANGTEVEIEIDADDLALDEDEVYEEIEAEVKERRKPNPAAKYALIALIFLYLAYRMFTKG